MQQKIKLFNKEQLMRYWRDPKFVLDFIKSLTCLSFALLINYFAVRYATASAGPPLPDRILDALPFLNTYYLDYYLAFFVQLGTFLFVLTQPLHVNFYLRALSLLIIVRAFFINLTQLGIPSGSTPTQSFFTQGGDLFFSGHTALPFMAALIFWEHTSTRYFFIVLSLVMGVEVLLGRQHYSIDVFAAPFITYSVFVIARKLFK